MNQKLRSVFIIDDVSIYARPLIIKRGNILYLNSKHNLIFLNDSEKVMISENEFGWIERNGEQALCFDQTLLKTLVFNINKNTLLNWQFVAHPKLKTNGEFSEKVVCGINCKGEFFYALVDMRSGEIINRINLTHKPKDVICSEKCFFSIVQNENEFLQCYSLNGSLCWEIDLQKLHNSVDTRQTGNLLLNDGKLYVVLASTIEKKHTTYVIDEITGKVLYRFENLAGSYQILNDILYKANRYSVDRIDTRTNALIRDDFEDILKPEKLWIHDDTSILTKDELLYFYDGATIGGNRIGVLDLKSHQLLWQAKLKIKSRYKSIRSMQLHEDILYVHADDDILHVFEKE